MAEAIDIRFERIAVDRLCSHARLVVVDGLGGVMQQGGYFLTVGYAQSHQGIDADFRGQTVGVWHLQLAFWQQKLVQLGNETGIQLHECLVEAVVEHLRFLFFQFMGVETLQQVGSLVRLDLSAHQFAIIRQLADICGTDVHEEAHVGLSLDIGLYQLLVQFGELAVHLLQLVIHFLLFLVLLFHLALVFLQFVLLSVVDEGEDEDDDQRHAYGDEAHKDAGT